MFGSEDSSKFQINDKNSTESITDLLKDSQMAVSIQSFEVSGSLVGNELIGHLDYTEQDILIPNAVYENMPQKVKDNFVK